MPAVYGGIPEQFTSIRVLVPGTGARFRSGGLNVALQTARILGQLCPTEVVTYRVRQNGYLYLADLLEQEKKPGKALWLVCWGFDVPKLFRRLKGRPVIYHAHSTGYGFDIPPGLPVVSVSRNTLGYWGNRAPRNPLFLVPNALEQHWIDYGDRSVVANNSHGKRRSFDVLVQERKSSPYVLNSLVPALRQRGLSVEVQKGWTDDLVGLFNNSKVYLYDSSEYWRARGLSEGFGLPPLEAMACGCVVFSSLNNALSDFLTPGETSHQLGCGSINFDVQQIAAAVKDPQKWRGSLEAVQGILDASSEAACVSRWGYVLNQIQSGWSGWKDPSLALRSSSTAMLRCRDFIQRSRVKVKKIIERSS
ncbi:MAG: glycosyltransferase [Cyanobacteriota bacterium]|nr:glycosyltransferase [Cyanobacteriota bacterium]